MSITCAKVRKKRSAMRGTVNTAWGEVNVRVSSPEFSLVCEELLGKQGAGRLSERVEIK